MSGDGFLSRWARRKAEQKTEQTAAAAGIDRDAIRIEDAALESPESGRAGGPDDVNGSVQTIADPGDLSPAIDEAALSDEEIAALPPVEEMTRDSDLRLYLRKGVPAALKNAAMRRMWGLNPAISTYLDPARDYFWDYNAPSTITGFGGSLSASDAAAYVGRLLDRPEKATVEEAEVEEASAPLTADAAMDPETNADPDAMPVEEEAMAVSALRRTPEAPHAHGSERSDEVVEPDGPPEADRASDAISPTSGKQANTPKAEGGAVQRRRHGGALPS